MAKAGSDPKNASGSGWSAFLGAVLGSGVMSALVGLIPIYFPAPRSFEWAKTGLPAGDCTATDTAATYFTSSQATVPQAENCGAGDVDTIAVCWDGVQYKNAANPRNDSSARWCTYKAIKVDQCKGGVNPGIIWACRAVQKAQKG